jgi:hypothetical protein
MNADELAAVQTRLDASLPYDPEASTITVVVGLSAREVLEAFGADPDEPPVAHEDTWDDDTDPETVLLVERPGYVITVEFNGFEGSRHEVLEPASAGGRAASVYWNVNMHTRLSLGEAGTVLFAEEIYDDLGSEDPSLAPLFTGLDFDEHWLASALTVVERFTGVRVDGPPPPEPLAVHRIHPRLRGRATREPTPEEAADTHRHSSEVWALGQDIGEEAAQLLFAGFMAAAPGVRRRVAAYAVRRALRAAGLENHDDVQATLATLETEPVLTPETEWLIRRGTHIGYNTPTPPAQAALHAIDAAVGADTLAAALDSARWAVAAIEAAAQVDVPRGRRLMDWEWQEIPTPRGRHRVARDLRAFLEELFARLGVTPGDGVLPEVPPAPPEAAGGAWQTRAPWPYAPWLQATAAWTGAEALVFGTREEPDTPYTRLGIETGTAAGAYDPVRDRWRPVTPPPFDASCAQAVALGWVVYLLTGWTSREQQEPGLWAYSVPGDDWRRIPLPPEPFQQLPQLTGAGGRLVLWACSPWATGETVWLYEPIGGQWSKAPENPWVDCSLRQVVGLADGRIVRLDAPVEPRPDIGRPFGGLVVTLGGVHEEIEEDEDDGDDPGNPTHQWRAAVLDPGATRWRTTPFAPVAQDLWSEARWVAVGGTIVSAHRGSRTARVPDHPSGLAKLPLGGVLDIDAGTWSALPQLPGRDLGEPMRGQNTLREIAGGGTQVALHNGWAYDVARRLWIELPSIPDRDYGFMSAASVWAGDLLLLFANAAVERVEDDEYDTRVVRVHDGWAWQPPHG